MTVDGIKKSNPTPHSSHFGDAIHGTTYHASRRDKLFVFPLLDERGRGHYILGFEQKQFESIRRGEFPTFRCDSPKTTSPSHGIIPVLGISKAFMEENFQKAGLIPK